MSKKELKKKRKSLALFLQRSRVEAGMSQELLAEKSGVSVATIQRMEYDGPWFSLEHLVKVAPFIAVDLSTLDILA